MALDPNAMFRFRYRDRRTNGWVVADEPATLDAIAERYDDWQVTGVCGPEPYRPRGGTAVNEDCAGAPAQARRR